MNSNKAIWILEVSRNMLTNDKLLFKNGFVCFFVLRSLRKEKKQLFQVNEESVCETMNGAFFTRISLPLNGAAFTERELSGTRWQQHATNCSFSDKSQWRTSTIISRGVRASMEARKTCARWSILPLCPAQIRPNFKVRWKSSQHFKLCGLCDRKIQTQRLVLPCISIEIWIDHQMCFLL